MKIKKLVCILTMAVIAVSSFTGNTLAYSDAPKVEIESLTYILKQNVKYGEKVKIPYSATVVEIPNIQKVEIPEKVTFDGIEYTVTDLDLDGHYLITAGNRTTSKSKYTQVEEIVLPDTIYNVTELEDFPNLRKINLPKNTAIGRVWSDGVIDWDNHRVGDYAIYYSDIGSSKIVFSDFIDTDHCGYFSHCPKLKLSVDPNNPYYSYKNDILLSKDEKKVLMSFNHSTDITFPAGVEDICDFGGFGFYHVKNVKLPDTLKRLGGTWNSIKRITLPKGLEEIASTFAYSKLTKIIIPDSVKEIWEGAFFGSNLKSVKFGKNLTIIETRAFKNCKNLKSVTIPKKVEKLVWAAFKNCKKLKNVKILSSNVEIGTQVFKNCTNLKSITINGAKEINGSAFDDCKKLSKITINNKKKAPKVSNGGFKNTKNGIKFVVKNKKVAKGLKKQLVKSKSKIRNAKIIVGKKVVYTINAKK